MKKFDKCKFLDSEFGRNLRVKIKSWDEALFDTQKDSLDQISVEKYINSCAAYWEAAQTALKYFTGKDYHFSRTEKYCGIIDENGIYLLRVR